MTLALLGAEVGASSSGPEDPYAEAYEQGDTVAEAYLSGDAATFRLMSTDLMLAMDEASIDDVELQIQALTDLVAHRSAEGLETLLVAGVEELDDRGYDGHVRALAHLEAIAAAYWNSEQLLRPNARVPLRLGGPLVRHVPLELVRNTLETQLVLGDAQFERALGIDQCSQAAIAQYAQRFGAGQGDLLQQLCDRMSGATGGMGIGPLGMLSESDCFGTGEPTRAERLNQLMMDCLDSITDGEQSPVASGGNSPFVKNLIGSGGSLSAHKEGSATVYRSSGEDKYRVEPEGADGGQRITYYGETGGTKKVEIRDSEGNLTYERWEEVDVSVEIIHDGDATFEVYKSKDPENPGSLVITRDADGNVIEEIELDGDGKVVSSGGDPVAETPECFELELALAHEQARARLESDGIAPGPETVNPGLEDADVPPAGPDCFGDGYGGAVDDTFGCIDQVVICEMGSLPDADCQCQPTSGTVDRNVQCGMRMMCLDGTQPQWVGGVCERVGSEPGFVEPDLIEPTPDPIAEGEIFESYRW